MSSEPARASARTSRAPIAFVSNCAWNLANFRRPLIEGLVAGGHDVLALAAADGHEAKLLELGARFIPIPVRGSGLSPMEDIRLLLALGRILVRERPSHLFSFTVKPNVYAPLAARATGVRAIPTVSGLGSSFLAGGLLSKLVEGLYGLAFRSAQTVLFQNQTDRELFVSRGLVEQDQSRVVPGSGVDVAHFEPVPLPPETPVRFLYIGRMLRDKGLVELAEAARIMKAGGSDARITLLGDAAADNPSAIPSDRFRSWLDEGLFDHHPPVEDVRPFIAGAHCVILPSYREGLPRSLLEGAAMGRPLVASDVTGCRDVVIDGINGLLCAPRSGEALANALLAIEALSQQAREEMGAAGRQMIVRDFAVERVYDAYLEELVT